MFLQSDYYKKEIASEDNTGYNVVPRGYFTYRHMSDDEIFRFNINTIVDKGIVSTLYPVFTITPLIDPCFLRETLNNGPDFQKYALLQKQGGSRTYMYFEKLKALTLPLPPLEEQRRIAEILTTQDKIIALKERRLAEKRRQKTFLAQRLLTGKTRLPSFDGEWQRTTLGAVTQKEKEKNTNFQYSLVLSNSAQHGIVPQSEQFSKEIANEENIDRYYIVRNGFFVYNPRISVTAPCGPIHMNETGNTGVMSPLYTVFSIRSVDKVDVLFLKLYLESTSWHKYMKSVANYGARHDRMNVSDDDFFLMPIPLPNLKEQQAIAEVLTCADREIEALQRDLELEKRKKKALMQLLLTGVVRVNSRRRSA